MQLSISCKGSRKPKAISVFLNFADMEKQWCLREIPDQATVQNLSESIQISYALASLIAQRGIADFEAAKLYFNPNYSQLHDPFLMLGMEKAVQRIKLALDANEKILIYGDYDVDGTTSVSLLYLFFRSATDRLGYYVPDRNKEGYGISIQGIDFAKEHDFSLIIALDCGIKAVEQVDYAKSKGIDFIICDHHLPGDKIPEAVAVLDPKQADCPYPYKELSGCGIGFKLICALKQRIPKFKANPFIYIDLVAVSIGCDIVPITGENRILAHFGLAKFNEQPLAGLGYLKQLAAYNSEFTIGDVVFKIGPRINAAGRISHAKDAVRLLTSELGQDESIQLAKEINEFNNTRKNIESEIFEACCNQVEENDELKDSVSLVLHGKDWHKGVIGIVASKIVEKYYKPTVILTSTENGYAVGSARSIESFDIHSALQACDFLFERFGGHSAAAGLTLKEENIETFRDSFDDVVRSQITSELLQPKLWYDLDLSIMSINWSMLKTLQRIGPFGPKNMRPTFVSRNVPISNAKVLKDKHFKFRVFNGTEHIDCVAFNTEISPTELKNYDSFDICFTVETNEWQGNRFLQLRIKDLRPV